MTTVEQERVERLRFAEAQAVRLFDEVVARGLLVPGRTEVEVSDDVRDLAAELLGVEKHWHKRIVRSGPNTLEPYRVNPPLRTLGEDDILFLDFGPVFEDWEADFGRTYVLGDDPVKHRLRDDLELVWSEGRAHFEATPSITGAELYAYVASRAEARGWEFGGSIAGHLVGHFPHDVLDGEREDSYIAPGVDRVLRTVDVNGERAHWILEVHLVDRERQIGGFFEQLLDL